MHGDAQPRAGALERAVDHGIDAKGAAGGGRIGIAEHRHRGRRTHDQLPARRELGRDRVGEAVADVRVVGRRGEIAERKHGDRERRRLGFALEAAQESPQIGRELFRRRIPLLGAFAQAAIDDALQFGRRVEALRVVEQRAMQRLARARRGVRAAQRDELVEHAAEGEDIGARIDRAAADLLGRHVADRADNHAVGGEIGVD